MEASCSTRLTPATPPSGLNSALFPMPNSLKLRPSPGRIAVTAIQTDLLRYDGKTPGGVILPTDTNKPRELRGYVIGVGEGIDGVEFGDFVALRRWGDSQTQFLKNPLKDVVGWWGTNPIRYWGDHAGSSRLVEADMAEQLMIGSPSMLLYRINTLAGQHRGDLPRIDPLFNRVLVRNMPKPDKSAGGVALISDWFRNHNPLAQVVAIGCNVARGTVANLFNLGHWVLCHPNRGTLIHYGNHELTLLDADDIALHFGATPPARVGWLKAAFTRIHGE